MSADRLRHSLRAGLAFAVFLGLGLATCLTVVRDGQAAVVLRFGAPVRVTSEPGIIWHLPPPIERLRLIDLRLRSSSSGVYDVQTADGATLAVESFAGWQVGRTTEAVLAFVRAVDGDQVTATAHLRGLLGSGMQTISGRFRLAELLGAGASTTLPAFESALSERLRSEAVRYGIVIQAVGLERLMLPERIVEATVAAMVEERNAAAARIRAAGQERAGQLVAEAEAAARTAMAEARATAATTTAEGIRSASALVAEAWRKDPELYRLVRSLDAVRLVFERPTALVLRADAAPFDALMNRPGTPTQPVLDPDIIRRAELQGERR
jgi:membrane protease subunit HflC